uniref:Breast cancer susceptibility 1 n=1 Tax=Romanomermis culicivorax TaxID=13658 RepID=A0A915L3H6_ROMCU
IKCSRLVAKRSRRSKSPNILAEYVSVEDNCSLGRTALLEQESNSTPESKVSKYFANNMHTTLDMLEVIANDEQETQERHNDTFFDSLVSSTISSENNGNVADRCYKISNDSTNFNSEGNSTDNLAFDIQCNDPSPQMSSKTADLMSKFRKRPSLLSYPSEQPENKIYAVASQSQGKQEIVSSKDSGFDEESPSFNNETKRLSVETVIDLTLIPDEASFSSSVPAKLTNGCRTSGLRKKSSGATKNSNFKQISIRESLLAFSCKKH